MTEGSAAIAALVHRLRIFDKVRSWGRNGTLQRFKSRRSDRSSTKKRFQAWQVEKEGDHG